MPLEKLTHVLKIKIHKIIKQTKINDNKLIKKIQGRQNQNIFYSMIFIENTKFRLKKINYTYLNYLFQILVQETFHLCVFKRT